MTAPAPEFRSICIIGTGLMGASFALAARQIHGTRVTGCDVDPAALESASRVGAIDESFSDPRDAVSGADLVVIATPVGVTSGVAEQIAPHLTRGVVVTDLGSTKQTVVRDVLQVLPGEVTFIGGHPIAGSERKGASAASSDLFRGASWVLTPSGAADDSVDRLAAFIKRLGARIMLLDPYDHDRALAMTSHLPQLISSSLMASADRYQRHESPLIVGSGFRDMTRLAASDPDLWVDIATHNQAPIVDVMDRMIAELTDVRESIAKGRWEMLRSILGDAKQAREALMAAPSEGEA